MKKVFQAGTYFGIARLYKDDVANVKEVLTQRFPAALPSCPKPKMKKKKRKEKKRYVM
jgi:hypothetical protein